MIKWKDAAEAARRIQQGVDARLRDEREAEMKMTRPLVNYDEGESVSVGGLMLTELAALRARVAELRRREKEHLALLREIRDMVHGAIARAEAEEAGKGGA